MRGTLLFKLLRDIRLPLLAVVILLAGFECLWAKISQRITEELVPSFTQFMPLMFIKAALFEGPGKLIQTFMGGESIDFTRALDMLSIGYVHPLVQTILCIWAVGRASGAIAGEIDRGTMELLLAQPVARYRVVLAHLGVDLVTIPILCLAIWAGNWIGVATFGHIVPHAPASATALDVDPRELAPGFGLRRRPGLRGERLDDVLIGTGPISGPGDGFGRAAHVGAIPGQHDRPALGCRGAVAALHHFLLLPTAAGHPPRSLAGPGLELNEIGQRRGRAGDNRSGRLRSCYVDVLSQGLAGTAVRAFGQNDEPALRSYSAGKAGPTQCRAGFAGRTFCRRDLPAPL